MLPRMQQRYLEVERPRTAILAGRAGVSFCHAPLPFNNNHAAFRCRLALSSLRERAGVAGSVRFSNGRQNADRRDTSGGDRVVVLRGNRVEEFDFESSNRKQLRGNIYLAKVTRVEPSLQAAFVDYGGNRHGFLAFSEIHPDYYQIPVADRQALIAQEEHDHRAADGDIENSSGPNHHRVKRTAAQRRHSDVLQSEPLAAEEFSADTAEAQPRNSTPANRRPNMTADAPQNRKNPHRPRLSSLPMNRRP